MNRWVLHTLCTTSHYPKISISKVESFGKITHRLFEIYDERMEQVEEIVDEQSDLLLDYIEAKKFINQTTKRKFPTKQRFISCGDIGIVENVSCLPILIINYLEKKQLEIKMFSLALYTITNYFDKARRHCDNVLHSRERCEKLIVSKNNVHSNLIHIDFSAIILSVELVQDPGSNICESSEIICERLTK